MPELPCLDVENTSAHETTQNRETYSCTVRRLPILLITMPYFMEVVLVQLPHEACEVAVLEVFGEDRLCEFLVLDLISSNP